MKISFKIRIQWEIHIAKHYFQYRFLFFFFTLVIVVLPKIN